MTWLFENWRTLLIMLAGSVLLIAGAYMKGCSDGREAVLAEQARAAQEGTNRADQDEQGRREAAQNRADAIEGVIDNAIAADPERANKAAGPATSGVLNELRRRR